jgi:hypothetical protein
VEKMADFVFRTICVWFSFFINFEKKVKGSPCGKSPKSHIFNLVISKKKVKGSPCGKSPKSHIFNLVISKKKVKGSPCGKIKKITISIIANFSHHSRSHRSQSNAFSVSVSLKGVASLRWTAVQLRWTAGKAGSRNECVARVSRFIKTKWNKWNKWRLTFIFIC